MEIVKFFLILWIGSLLVACNYVSGDYVEPNSPLRLTALDVGQGLAILLEYKGRFAMYDVGPDSIGILDSLKARNVNSLEWVVLSHNHRDHVGGFFELTEEIPIKHLFVSPDTAGEIFRDSVLQLAWLKSIEVDTLWRGEALSLAGPGDVGRETPRWNVLWPSDYMKVGDNEASIVLELSFGVGSCLLVGDLDSVGERRLLELSPDLSVDLLQVGHHGSSGSSSLRFLSTISPNMALISVGKKNGYGHPKGSVLKKLSLVMGDSSKVYRTDRLGSLDFYLYENLGVLVH